MNTCKRCGLLKFDWKNANEAPSPTCGAVEGMFDRQLVDCRDRQLAKQAADLAKAERALIAADDIRNRHRGEPENWDDYDALRDSASTVKP